MYFDQYRVALREQQSQVIEKIPWGETVVAGSHAQGTLDFYKPESKYKWVTVHLRHIFNECKCLKENTRRNRTFWHCCKEIRLLKQDTKFIASWTRCPVKHV